MVFLKLGVGTQKAATFEEGATALHAFLRNKVTFPERLQ